jgi:hypothetical protein
MEPRAGMNEVEKREFLILPGFELRSLGRPSRSYSLCRLRYPGSILMQNLLLLNWMEFSTAVGKEVRGGGRGTNLNILTLHS